MKKLLLTSIAALFLATGTVHASIVETYECGATRPADNDRDPIVKIKIGIAISAGDNHFYAFDVDHYAASGKVYSRQEQYRDRRFWSNAKADSWSGVSIRTPNLTMVGSINSSGHYIEKKFRGGRLLGTTVSACRVVEEESH